MWCSSRHGDEIAFGIERNVVIYRISDMTEGKEIARMAFDREVFSVAFNLCGTLVVAGMAGGLIEMRSLLDAEFKRVFQGHADLVRRMLFSLCGSFLISGSFDSTIKIWDSAAGVCWRRLTAGAWSTVWLFFLGDGRSLLGLMAACWL